MGSKSQSQSPPTSVKRPRKKARPPQVISEATWRAIELAIVGGGLGYSECGRRFNVSPFAIMMKARRRGWAVPSKIAERAAALQARYVECEQDRNSNAMVIEAAAQSWAERGEAHRALVYDLTNAALRKVAKAPPPLESWSDIERADKAGRRSCGLDDSERNQNINIGMQLINQRLEFITADLPKEID